MMKLTIRNTNLDIQEGSVFLFDGEFYMIIQNVDDNGWRLLCLDGLVLQSKVYKSLEGIIEEYNIKQAYDSELIVNA